MTFATSPAPATPTSSIFDLGKLNDLKRRVAKESNSEGDQREVAAQFEALYLQILIKQMRASTLKTGVFHSNHTRMLQDLSDEQLALQMATPGVGLAQALLNQIHQSQGPAHRQSNTSKQTANYSQLEATKQTSNASPTANASAGVLNGRPVQYPSVAQAYPITSSPKVTALLNVLNHNRPVDRALASSEGTPNYIVDFVSRMAEPAKTVARESGLSARLIMGQAALESGWGKNEIRRQNGQPSYNLFGIKAGDNWKGEVVKITTTEYIQGIPKKIIQPFRVYASYKEAFRDYAQLMKNSPRYEAVMSARNETEAAHCIQQAGYATDPRYAAKLIDVMEML